MSMLTTPLERLAHRSPPRSRANRLAHPEAPSLRSPTQLRIPPRARSGTGDQPHATPASLLDAHDVIPTQLPESSGRSRAPAARTIHETVNPIPGNNHSREPDVRVEARPCGRPGQQFCPRAAPRRDLLGRPTGPRLSRWGTRPGERPDRGGARATLLSATFGLPRGCVPRGTWSRRDT